MEIYKSGTEVETKFGKLKGMITACEIRFDHVRYEITFWNQAEQVHSVIWQHEAEFTTEAEKVSIGFKNHKR